MKRNSSFKSSLAKRSGYTLMLGNNPGELVSNYNGCPYLDPIIQAHYDAWEGRAQPTIKSDKY